MQGIEPSKINSNRGALNMKTPQVKPEWNTGIYIGNGVVAVKEKEKEENCECGLMEDGTWSEELFDKFGCTCD